MLGLWDNAPFSCDRAHRPRRSAPLGLGRIGETGDVIVIVVKSSEGLRALAMRARHLAENVVTDPELVRGLLAQADELDENARRLEGRAKAEGDAPGEEVGSRST